MPEEIRLAAAQARDRSGSASEGPAELGKIEALLRRHWTGAVAGSVPGAGRGSKQTLAGALISLIERPDSRRAGAAAPPPAQT